MKHEKLLVSAGVVVLVLGVSGFVAMKFFDTQVSRAGGMARAYVDSIGDPQGTLTTETNPAYKPVAFAAPAVPATPAPAPTSDEWPSYNKTLTTERFSPLTQINNTNAGKLKVVCTYDTGSWGAFESGLLMVRGALIGTTQYDIFSLDPNTCKVNWRTHENYPGYLLPTNRGAAYMDGVLYRGTQDGRVLAYDFNTGKRLWATPLVNTAKRGETLPAAPIAWNGMVFIGNAGGDVKGGKGKLFALDGKTGKVLWQYFNVPRTPDDLVLGPVAGSAQNHANWKSPEGFPISGGGTWTSLSLDPATGRLYQPVGNPAPDFAIDVRQGSNLFTNSIVVHDARTGTYQKHYQMLPEDWHDWDASNPPALITTRGGRQLMAAAPKDGYLYGYDRADDRLLYKVPATTIRNVEERFAPGKDVSFCPGSVGGAEWNSPAYDPRTNLIVLGENDWCATVKVQDEKQLRKVPIGQPWMGDNAINPFNMIGHKQVRGEDHWAGWLTGFDADTGVWKWRVKTDYPIVAGVTPTAGGVVFFGDLGGHFYAVDADTGRKLYGKKMPGPMAGGVITYATPGGAQRVAVATGFNNIFWPVKSGSEKVVILGLDEAAK
ncbi:PQQ-binding-like beta-propeller repeat protein [Caulobacter sp. 17J65-9]|uniref:outer membrane protein assembly factor BamB family protein n=1 Tax=Caulobacter sp. 17J65-9 TaxID=2709382 RepID=UPI0013CB00CC|nr:PQQ-binding-like beta-propeller repeat protein [Caulobacter sp. 17J65-9]NEX94021.1 PQQ-binding-like beta-propeller repeat protein [Caulobacter sp. 17J65-9]